MKSLHAENASLSLPQKQLQTFQDSIENNMFASFQSKIKESGEPILYSSQLEVFQLNMGKMCNQVCKHCHVDAGPDRKEKISKELLETCLEILRNSNFTTVDITGGAPEMHPDFRWFVEEVSALGLKIIVRCNLTIIVANPKYHDLPEFYKKHKVEVVSSLPYFTKIRTDAQRGKGVFEDSIKALTMLNAVGYGVEGTGLILNLVYNPTGAFLPDNQESLEKEFKQKLNTQFQIQFSALFAITNLPISRFLDYLLTSGNYIEYMTKLVEAFNPATLKGLMCKNTISVSWDGFLYDCDFNQMLDLKVNSISNHLSRFSAESLQNRTICIDQHCFGCTAGAGSSCGGQTT